MKNKRIIVGQIMHESSALAKNLTEVENFKRTLIWYEGDDVFTLSKIGMKDYLTGIIDRNLELDFDVKPCFCTFASPSGIISKECFAELFHRFLTIFQTISPLMDSV